MNETQKSISIWAERTFGKAQSNARIAVRANEEMSELLKALISDDNHPKAKEEIADIFIVLYRLASRLDIDVQDEINAKMKINRKREWKLDDMGYGYHYNTMNVSESFQPLVKQAIKEGAERYKLTQIEYIEALVLNDIPEAD